jgi:phosphoglycolate phosphatase-like HAD superfamily hydrolase
MTAFMKFLRDFGERNIISAIATYKREDYALTLLDHFHFDQYTKIMHGADHENHV